RFFWDNLLDVLLVGLPDVFGLHLTVITPDDDWSRGVTTVMRLLMGVGLFEFGWLVYKLNWARDEFHGTVPECHHHCKGLPDVNVAVVTREATVEDLGEGLSARAADFLKAFPEPERAPSRPEDVPPGPRRMTTTDEITRAWGLDDPRVYRWKVGYAEKGKTFGAVFVQLVTGVLALPVAAYVLFWLIGFIHPWLQRVACQAALGVWLAA